jgi:ribosomal-protein-alanine N-acetyltransferase
MPSAPPNPTIPTLNRLELVLDTERVRLRPFTRDDIDALWPVVSDPDFPKMMSWAAHGDREVTAGFIAATLDELAGNTGVTWAIERAGRAIGCIALDSITWALRAWRVDRAELGYWLAPAHWGQGLMTEAAAAVVRCAFQTIGLHKLKVGCISENAASRRVIEKLGFRFVGRLEDDVWRDGRWWSHLRYEMTAPEWPDVHTTMRMERPKTQS